MSFTSKPNVSCAGLRLDVIVTTPNRGPAEVVFVGGSVFHPAGRVHDCVEDGSFLAVGTAETVELYDTKGGSSRVVASASGGTRVTMGSGWIAWATFDGKVSAMAL